MARMIAAGALAAAALAGCGLFGPPPPAPPALPRPGPDAGGAARPDAPAGQAVVRGKARWVAARFSDLPGWERDRLAEWWTALLRSCERPAPGWSALCAEALLRPPADDEATRAWLAERLSPWRVESLEGEPTGLATGYYEPVIDGARTRRDAYQVPLYAPPPDLAQRQPWWTRREIDSLPAAQAALRGREVAWVADPIDALVLQIQGSGRLRLAEADGRARTVRLAYAGHNGQPYASVGAWLVQQGELRAGEASLPAIRDWARRNPQRVRELLWANPRVVFFKEEALPDPTLGPRGAQGVPLTPGRSVAVDPLAVPYGTPLWLDTTEPLSATPLQRLVMAQDTGTAITGAVRADYFWGPGPSAEAQAGRMKQPLRWWALWPRGALPGSPS
jgi:membrane-bound lytic murein transglycosylase A